MTNKLPLSPLSLDKKSQLWEDFCFEAALREPYPVGKQHIEQDFFGGLSQWKISRICCWGASDKVVLFGSDWSPFWV